MKPLLADRSPSLQRVLERQLRNWEIDEHVRHEHPTRRQFTNDYITISRPTGGRGEEVAVELGRRLGWKVFDRELLDLMSEHHEYRRRLYSTVDERQQSWIDGLLILCSPETGGLRNDYRHALGRALLTIAHHESAIFVGRGAHLLLPPDVGVRVRVVARFDDRVEWLAKERSIKPDEARRALRRLDYQRIAYLKKNFGLSEDSFEDYDLTVNTSRLTIDQACETILTALRQKAAAHAL
jgi:cytidylate kinase